MINFGFLSLHLNHEKEHVTEIAKRAKAFGIKVHRFTPTSIHPATMLIDGLIFNDEKHTWEKGTFPIPHFLYDRCFYQNDLLSKKSIPIVAWLKNNPNTTFIGHGLPNKWHIYESLTNNKSLANYLPQTIKAESANFFVQKLKKEKRLILKPETGSQGRGIYDIQLQKTGILVKTHRNQQMISQLFSDQKSLILWLEKLLAKQKYLIQPFLHLQDEHGHPFDIRIFLQKDANGIWIERGRGIRKGKTDFFISNVSGGGEIISFYEWSQSLSKYQKIILQDGIDTIIKHLPNALENRFSSLFELGIDIGMDDENRIWILDTNSKPGRKVILKTGVNIEEELYTAPLQYCLQIAKQKNLVY